MKNITNNGYLPIPTEYSKDIKAIVDILLQKDPNNRLSITELLASEMIHNILDDNADLFSSPTRSYKGSLRIDTDVDIEDEELSLFSEKPGNSIISTLQGKFTQQVYIFIILT